MMKEVSLSFMLLSTEFSKTQAELDLASQSRLKSSLQNPTTRKSSALTKKT